MALWFSSAGGVEMGNQQLRYEPRVGGIFETEGRHQGVTPFLFTGKVLTYDPPRELTAEMLAVHFDNEPAGWPAPTLISFFLTPVDGGRTRVEIVHHAFERLGEAAQQNYEGFEGGWNMVQVTALRNLIETGSPS
jgi:uncharacterized protein YndB with AHSA1/START domain